MEEVCAVGHQLHQSDQVEVQVDETHQQVAAAAEMNIPYFMFKTHIALVLSSLTSDMYEIKLPSALLSLLAGRDAEEKKNVKIYILLVYLQNHRTT